MKLAVLLTAIVLFIVWPYRTRSKGRLRAKFRALTNYLIVIVAAIWAVQLFLAAVSYFTE
jgi:hypothetical protein